MKTALVTASYSVVCWLTLASLMTATEYTVAFNCWNSTGSGGCRKEFNANHPGIDDSAFSDYQWGSVGASKGSRILNNSSKTIRAIKIWTDNADDTFKAPADAGGVLFTKVWRKKDGKQVLFNTTSSDPGLPSGKRFWSYVNPETPGFPAGYFNGRAFDQSQPDPNPAEWELIGPQERKTTKLPFARFPSEYREVRTYWQDPNLGTVLVSDDDILWLSPDYSALHNIRYSQTIPTGANRVTLEQPRDADSREFVIWKDGEEILRVPAAKPPVWQRNLLRHDHSKQVNE